MSYSGNFQVSGGLPGKHTNEIFSPGAWAPADQVSCRPSSVLVQSWQIPHTGAGKGEAEPGSLDAGLWVPGDTQRRAILSWEVAELRRDMHSFHCGVGWALETGCLGPSCLLHLASYVTLRQSFNLAPISPPDEWGQWQSSLMCELYAGQSREAVSGWHFVQAHKRSPVNVSCSSIKQTRISGRGLRTTYVRMTMAGVRGLAKMQQSLGWSSASSHEEIAGLGLPFATPTNN